MAAERQPAESCRSDGAGILSRKNEERYARPRGEPRSHDQLTSEAGSDRDRGRPYNGRRPTHDVLNVQAAKIRIAPANRRVRGRRTGTPWGAFTRSRRRQHPTRSRIVFLCTPRARMCTRNHRHSGLSLPLSGRAVTPRGGGRTARRSRVAIRVRARVVWAGGARTCCRRRLGRRCRCLRASIRTSLPRTRLRQRAGRARRSGSAAASRYPDRDYLKCCPNRGSLCRRLHLIFALQMTLSAPL